MLASRVAFCARGCLAIARGFGCCGGPESAQSGLGLLAAHHRELAEIGLDRWSRVQLRSPLVVRGRLLELRAERGPAPSHTPRSTIARMRRATPSLGAALTTRFDSRHGRQQHQRAGALLDDLLRRRHHDAVSGRHPRSVLRRNWPGLCGAEARHADLGPALSRPAPCDAEAAAREEHMLLRELSLDGGAQADATKYGRRLRGGAVPVETGCH